jgi:regulator of cell morphogenesis and NO signaling
MDTTQVLDIYMDDLVASRLVTDRYTEIESELNDASFCNALKELYINPESFNPRKFEDTSLETLIRYIELTHTFYLHRRLPEISQSVTQLIQSNEMSASHSSLIQLFFQSYTVQLALHIEKEDKGIMAFARKLNAGQNDSGFNTEDFLEEHDNVDSILLKLSTLLVTASPNSAQLTFTSLLYTQIQLLQRDLYIHSKIEEEIFLDKLIKKENLLKK